MAVSNLQSTLELNEAIAKQAKLLARSTKELKDQLAITQAMAGLKSGQDQEQIVEHIKKMNLAIREASTSSEELGTGLESIFERIANGAGKIVKDGKGISKWLEMTHKRMPKMTIIALGFFSGFAKGMKNIANLGKGAVTVIAGMASSIFELSKAIISIPFKILGGLVEMANSMPGGTAFAQAREDIRKEFGTFEQDVSANIKASFKSLRGELAETGLSVYRVLGNMAERLKYVHELASGMGTMFHIFGMEVAANAEAMIAYQKGLGISAEQMKTVGLAAVTAGRSMTDVLNEITIASTGMGDAFGMSHKVISRDMADMMADVTHFTSITAHEMAKASVYVRKLGMEIKDLVSMIDKYDNFEDAAVGAAHLAQAFGANVDALEMMKEQDPSKRLDMLRKSMAMAGVDAAKLTRQELKLLAQQTGLSEEAAKAAFSLKNQGTSMADLEKQQARNQKKTMTQEEAMSKLSNSIERMVKSGQRSGGFFTQFFKGFESGIKWSREFWGLMRNIRHSLRVVYWAGRQVGRLFVEHFPGVKQMIGALRDFFHPGRFRDLMKKIKAIFGDFFKMMSTDPTTALPKLLEKLKTTFFDFFSSGSPAGSKFLSGLQKFGSAVGHILGSLVRIGLEKLRDFFTFLSAVIKDPGKISGAVNAAKSGGKAGGSAMLKMFMPLIDAIMQAGPPMLKALGGLLKVVWGKFKAMVIKFAKENWKPVAMALFGPAVLRGVFTAIMTMGFQAVIGGAKTLLLKGFKSLTATAQTSASAGASKLSLIAKKLGIAGLVITAAMGTSEGIKKYSDLMDAGFKETERKMGAATAGIIDAITFGLLPDDFGLVIANAVAKLSSAVLKAVESAFGPTFTNTLREYMSSSLDMLASLGDLVSATFTGDEAKITASTEELIKKIGDVLWTGIKFIFIGLPVGLAKGLAGLLKFSWKLIMATVKGLYDGIATFISNALGMLFGDKVRQGVQGFLDFFLKLYDGIDMVFRDIGSAIESVIKLIFSPVEWGSAIKGFFEGIGPSFENGWKRLKNFGTGLFTGPGAPGEVLTAELDKVQASFDAMLAEVTINESKYVSRASDKLKGVAEKLTNSPGAKAFLKAKADADARMKIQTTIADRTTQMKKASKSGISYEDMSLYDSVKNLNPKKIAAVLKTFRKDVIPLFIGENGLKAAINELGAGISEGDIENIAKLSLISDFSSSITAIGTSISGLATLKLDGTQLDAAMASIELGITKFQSGVTGIGSVMSDETTMHILAVQAKVATVAQVITSIVENVSAANKDLTDLKISAVAPKLRNLANVLGVKQEKFTIKNDKVRIDMSLQVNLEAESLAYAIWDGKYFDLRAGEKGYPKKRV